MRKLHHIGIAVKDLEEALKAYTDGLGLSLTEIEELEDRQVRAALLQLGESRLELLEATDPDSVIASFVKRFGPGIHHFAIEVDDIEQALQTAEDNGLELIDREPDRGAGGMKVAFIHPKSIGGVLIELCEQE
jgi:methylmalonyl-CoA/ethylmalonyl-CoA epimerase